MNSAIYEAMAEVLREHRKLVSNDVSALTDALRAEVKGIEIKSPERGTGIKCVELHADNSAFDLIFDNDEAVTIPLPAPVNGKDADHDQIIKSLKEDAQFVESITGASGTDADPETVAKHLASNEKFLAEVKGERGEAGAQGPAGADGLDCPVIDLTICKQGQVVERGALVKFRGGIWQATRKANGSPEEEPTAYRLVINGVSGVNIKFNLTEREYTITTECADDSRETVTLEDLPRFIEPREHAKRIAGDFYFADDILQYVDKAGDWQEVNLRGRRGRNGATGVGIAGLKMIDDSVMEITLTNNETVSLDFMPAIVKSIKAALGDLIDEYFKAELENFKAEIIKEVKAGLEQHAPRPVKNAIKRFAGHWRTDENHKAGDVVTAPQGLFLALKDTSAPVLTNDWQCLMPANQSIVI